MDSITYLQGSEPKDKKQKRLWEGVWCLWTTFLYPIQLRNGLQSWTLLLGLDPNTHLPVNNKCRAGLLY